jgi:hypothetical protein
MTAEPIKRIFRWTHAASKLHLAGVLLLVAGLVRAWLQPALSSPQHATDLTIILPAGRHLPVSWGLLLAIAAVITIVGLTPWGNRWPVLTETAAVLAIASTLGFLIQSCLLDRALQQRLRRDESDLGYLQRLVGYQIPRPHLTTLGPIPLPGPAADVISGLRSGFYLALLGAVLVATGAVARRRRQAPLDRRPRRYAVAVLSAVAVVVLAIGLAQSTVAARSLRLAEAAAATGDYTSAVARFRTAFSQGSGLERRPDTAAEYGTSLLGIGATDGPEAQLASSRLQLQAGHDLTALRTVATASDRWPANTALRDEFTTQAFGYLRRRGDAPSVHRLLPRNVDCAVLRVMLAQNELATGDNPAAITDARAAESMTADVEVRSIALTFLAIGQSRSGDLIGGRRTLLAAVDADRDFVNVMARSLLAGLYTTLPQ